MQPTTQDIVKGLDLTGVSSIGASQINQVTDTANPASDKGLVVTTTDTAIGVPEVPDAVTNIKWVRYIWKRLSHATDPADRTYCYIWNPEIASDATYLRWERLDRDAATAITNSAAALAAANAAQATANTANSTANTANTKADDAIADVITLEASVLGAQVSLAAIQILVNLISPTGHIQPTMSSRIYSNTVDEGWLNMEGQEVPKSVFSALYTAIGDIGGVSSNPATLFVVPDAKKRGLMGFQAADGTFGTMAKKNGALTAALVELNLPELKMKSPWMASLINSNALSREADAAPPATPLYGSDVTGLVGSKRVVDDSAGNHATPDRVLPYNEPRGNIGSATGQPIDITPNSLVCKFLIKT